MLVNNWQQVIKSLAVWLPIIATGVVVVLENTVAAGLIPIESIPVVVAVTGALGWVIKQKSITK